METSVDWTGRICMAHNLSHHVKEYAKLSVVEL
jgi:hypothetical protein